MKKLILFIALFTSILSYGQTSLPSAPAPVKYVAGFELLGQMLNLSNTNKNEINDTSSGTLLLTTAQYSTTTSLPIGYAIVGSGKVSLMVSALATTTVNPTVTTTPQSSFDNIHWANIPGVTVSTLTPTSLTVALTTKWEFTDKYGLYYRLSSVVTNAAASVQGWWYFNKTFIYGN